MWVDRKALHTCSWWPVDILSPTGFGNFLKAHNGFWLKSNDHIAKQLYILDCSCLLLPPARCGCFFCSPMGEIPTPFQVPGTLRMRLKVRRFELDLCWDNAGCKSNCYCYCPFVKLALMLYIKNTLPFDIITAWMKWRWKKYEV